MEILEMKVCAKEGCENKVPKYFVDENGRKHNCQRRKFCLECSPYGQHNTKDLNNFDNRGVCSECGNPTQQGTKRTKCHSCYFNKRQAVISEKVYGIIGYDCWYCGYNKGKLSQSVLEFHHVSPESKKFSLTTREFVGRRWDVVFEEMKKCVSLCCRCHREYHADIIKKEEIMKVYTEKWNSIG
jgi:hypothetical protein